MIVYFLNRIQEVLGYASTKLPRGYEIIDDEITQDIDSGVASMTLTVAWSDDTRLQLEDWMQVGNLVLVEHENEAMMLTIITSETDTSEKAVSIYAEDAGLDLINEIAPAFTSDTAHPIDWYISQFLGDSGFEIGTNEIPDKTRTLSWDSDSTVTERIRSIATQFDNAEISYSFAVENLKVTHRYVNIWQKRGTDADQELRLDRDINSVRVITSVEGLVTGLVVTGGTPEGQDAPISLVGYSYDDGDIYIDSTGRLLSRQGAETWGRASDGLSYIMGTFSYDTTSQSELCNRAISYLISHREPAVNYEIDIEKGLESSRIGDRLNIVDDKGAIYVSARILELKASETQKRKEATLGEFLIKSSGISDKVIELAGQFQQLASDREFLYSISVSSSNGSYFVDSKVDTTLTASVLFNGAQVTSVDGAVVNWYSGDTLLGSGFAYHVNNQTTISIICRLERGRSILAEDYITLFSLQPVYQTAENALTKSNNSISSDTLHYLATSQGSGVTTSTAGWTTTVQTMTATNKYLWTYHTYTRANGTTVNSTPVITGTYGEKGSTGSKGDKGDTGVGVSKVQPEYYLSTSPSSATGGSWSTSLSYTSGKYIWTRDKVTYSNGTTNYSTEIYNGALTSACADAKSAKQVADNTAQYFWFTSSGSDTGAHISEKTQDEFIASPSGGNLLARSNGIAVRDGLDELAVFGADGSQIGKSDGAHTSIDNDGMQIYSVADGNLIQLANIGYGRTVDEEGQLWNNPHYTLGRRKSGSVVGSLSLATGDRSTASGYCSHAEGGVIEVVKDGVSTTYYPTASGNCAHAEGYGCTASGSGSHAEGNRTVASGAMAHAEGVGSVASGDYSHAEGYGTESASNYQTVVGRFNEVDSASKYLFIVGNGNTESDKKNAFTVDTKGNTWHGVDVADADITATVRPSAGSGMTLNSMRFSRYGRVAMLYLSVKKSSATASGGTLFTCTLPSSYSPVFKISGAGNTDAHTVIGSIGSNGSLSIVNASPSSIAKDTSVSMSFTYLLA